MSAGISPDLLKPVTEEQLALPLERLRAAHLQPSKSVPDCPMRYSDKAGVARALLELSRTSHFEFKDGAAWAYGPGEWRALWKALGMAEVAWMAGGWCGDTAT